MKRDCLQKQDYPYRIKGNQCFPVTRCRIQIIVLRQTKAVKHIQNEGKDLELVGEPNGGGMGRKRSRVERETEEEKQTGSVGHKEAFMASLGDTAESRLLLGDWALGQGGKSMLPYLC